MIRNPNKKCAGSLSSIGHQDFSDSPICNETTRQMLSPTNKNQSHFVRCSLFSSDTAPNYPAIHQNVNNLREFIDIKCRRESKIIECLPKLLAKSTDFRSIFEKSPSINSKLPKEQTLTFFLNSSVPLRRFCTENTKLHRITGFHVYSQENILRKKWKEQKMKTADVESIPLEISEAERKYNEDKEEISLSVYRADPEEVLCKALLDEPNENTPLCIVERLEVKTVFVSAGTTEADHGTLCSLLTCSGHKNNNSAKRRRTCIYMETPAVETIKNLIKLFNPVRSKVALLKDNSCFMIIEDTSNCGSRGVTLIFSNCCSSSPRQVTADSAVVSSSCDLKYLLFSLCELLYNVVLLLLFCQCLVPCDIYYLPVVLRILSILFCPFEPL